MLDLSQREHKKILPHDCVIIIVTWNCWEHLYNCLNALGKQTILGFHIIVVDNGDNNDQYISSLLKNSDLTYLKNDTNLGFAAGNNKALRLSQSFHWVILLNPDTIPDTDWFEQMILAANNYPEFAVFGSKLLQAENSNIIDGEGDSYHMSGYAWRNGMGFVDNKKRIRPWEIFSPCAAAALYKMSALKKVGGFDEDFFCYMEDVDLGFRLRLAGYRCLLIPEAKVKHVGSVTTGKRSPFYVYHGQRNLVWVYVKNMPGMLFYLFLPLHILLNVIGVLRYAMNGKFKVALRAKYDAIKVLPNVWKKRQIIQNERAVSLISIFKLLDKRPIPGLGRAIHTLWR